MGREPVGSVQGHEQADAGPSFPPAWYTLEAIPPVALRDGVTARFVTGGQIMMSFVQFAPKGVVERHAHPHEQCGYMLEGSMQLTIGDETREVRPGDAYTIPGGVEHRAVGGPQGGLALDIFSPVREDYRALASKVEPGN